jgi:L-alanine-DL-glutamate epimerase-like enolase superfamily enzyme
MQVSSVTGPAGWSAVGPVGHSISVEDLKRGLWIVQEIRKAVGDRMDIAIEGHSRWDLNCAIRIGKALEPYEVAWMEDIMLPDSAGDLARLARETRVPQTVSERLFTRYAYREILEAKAAHIIMPDVIWTGGLTEAAKIAALADTYHLSIAPHDCTGPINVFACLHLCAAVPNAAIMETVRGFIKGYYNELVDQPVPIREGQAVLSFGPGLGVSLRPDLFSRKDATIRTSQPTL